MKALLSHWIGGTKTDKQHISAGKSIPVESGSDLTRDEDRSFLGLMMGFLGMKQKEASSGKITNRLSQETKIPDSSGKKGKHETGGKQKHQVSMMLGAQIAAKEKVTHKISATDQENITKKEKNSTSPLSSSAAIENTRTDFKSRHPKGSKPLQVAEKNESTPNKSVQTAPADAVKQAGQTLKTETAGDKKAPLKNPAGTVRPQKAVVDGNNSKAKDSTTRNESRLVKQTVTVDVGSENKRIKQGQQILMRGEKSDTAFNKAPFRNSEKLISKQPLFNQIELTGKQRQAIFSESGLDIEQKQVAKDQQRNVTAGKKNNSATGDLMAKELKKQEIKVKGQAVKRDLSAGLGSSRPETAKSSSYSAQNTGFTFQKTTPDDSRFIPGKMFVTQHSGKGELEMDMNGSPDFKNGPDSVFKDIQASELKSNHFAEAAGRKSFSKQLAEVGRRHFSQPKESSRQTTQWKHHRFVLKDGNTVNIAARSTDGALQLQLKAGNGELGKMLHQHLQDIQQHVQQELGIEIDLQLGNFGEQQPGQQHAPSSLKQPEDKTRTDGSFLTSEGKQPAGVRHVRYLGFNKNEWTA